MCGEKGLMFPRLNSDRIIQTLKKWSVLSQEEQVPKFVDSHVHSFNKCLLFIEYHLSDCGFLGGLIVKNPPVNAGDEGSIPG